MKNFIKKYSFLFLILISSVVGAQLKAPAIFSDHMVLQQQSKVPIWGWAKAGEKVSISTTWSKEKVEAIAGKDGIWKTNLATKKAGGPYQITIKTSKEKIQIQDVLLGEVWVCSGQSNMAFYLKSALNGATEVANANYPTIRYLEVKRQVSATPLMDAPGSKWTPLSAANAASYSAVAIFFAQKLQKELKVPVGIIEAAWGGTAADNWTPKTVLENDKKLAIALNRFEEGERDFKMDSIGYSAQLAAKDKGIIKKVPEMPASMFIRARPHRAPSVLYNGLISPITNYGIKGVIWYQGETNRKWNNEYAYLLESMIGSWRKEWNNDFPFIIVQLPKFGGNNVEDVSGIMEAQLETYRNVKNTGLIVTMDMGDMDNIHPTNKRPVGDRIGNWVLANTYDYKNIDFSGPLFKNTAINGDELQVNFDFIGSGLKTNGDPIGFEIVTFKENGTLNVPFTIVPKVTKTNLTFDIKNITKPFILRYGWGEKMDKANLTNEANLPASSFRVLVK